MKLSEELKARGFIGQTTSGDLDQLFGEEKPTVYHGIDPSADSAHIGNMVTWMLLKHLAKAGCKIVFLVGGGTGMIGDPKPDAERVLSTREEVKARVEKIKAQVQNFFASEEVTFVDNYNWLQDLRLIDFLRDIGKHFTVNELVKKDAIAKRLNSEVGLSYTEFAYPLLQAFDYLELYRRHNCTLQVGGSDQWGNIVAGVELVRRVEGKIVNALTVPLVIDKTTGKKFGKSEGNAVWLDSSKTTPYDFYQFWLNVSDSEVVDHLKHFTFLELAEIAKISEMVDSQPEKRVAQKVLAKAVTALVHGEEKAAMVERVADIVFGEVEISALDKATKDLVLAVAPTTKIADGTILVDGLLSTGLAKSKREAREFIVSGAVALNQQKVTVVEEKLESAKWGNLFLLKRGKKHQVLVEIE